MVRASEEVRKIAKEKAIIFGLLPSKDIETSVKLLSEREAKRKHFQHMTKEELDAQTRKSFEKYPSLFENFCHHIIYTEEKTPGEIADEIVGKSNM
jgi:hypothetical protein